MKRLAIVHFMPLEYYPPITNLLQLLASEERVNVKVWSSENIKGKKPFNAGDVRVSRTSFPTKEQSRLRRFFEYWIFNFVTLLGLIFFRPDKILYYESYSAFPIYLYARFFRTKVSLYIHFHEYFPKGWYENGMSLVRWYHTFEEKYLFKKACWISQTNKKRLELFHENHAYLDKSKMKILANYPPLAWFNKVNAKVKEGHSVKTVCIGALSLSDTYIKEYCTWIINQKGNVLFDIYSYNLHGDTVNYLESLDSSYINFYKEGIEYHKIPELLAKYQIGLILYKANSENYRYNETNKLFEYLICGLDVWYSDKMESIKNNIDSIFPARTRSVNFESLNNNFLINKKNRRVGINNYPDRFCCEIELRKIIDVLKSE